MKALCVKQPWASLIVTGQKTLEVRSRRTSHRGPLIICSSRRDAGSEQALAASKLLPGSPYPRGVTLGIVDLVECRPARGGDRAGALCDPDGYFVWVLARPRPCRNVPIIGKLGVFELPEEVARLLD
jgi:hypothetical protein